MLDLLIKNARIVDGTGMPAYYSHVGIREGKIAVIAPVVREEAKAPPPAPKAGILIKLPPDPRQNGGSP